MNIDVDTQSDQTVGVRSNDLSFEGTERIRYPTSTEPDESKFWGAWVKCNRPGLNENVCYADLWSMYPNIIRTLNISLETFIGTQERLDESAYGESDCVWGYIDVRPVKRCESHEDIHQFVDGGYKQIYKWSESEERYVKKYEDPDGPELSKCYFLKPSIRRGVIPRMVDRWMELKDEAKGTDKYDSVKAVINSLYGVLGFATEYNSFRLFNWQLAECVTIVGRMMIQHTKDQLIEHINDRGGEAYLTHADTDGAGIAQPSVTGQSEALETIEQATEWMNQEGYRNWFSANCGLSEDDELYAEVEIEYFAPKLYLHHKKKRYCVHVTWEKGESCDDVEITGFEAIRSDVSGLTEHHQQWVLTQLVRQGLSAKSDLYERIRTVRQRVMDGRVPIESMGIRGGIQKELGEYGGDRRPSPIVRGAKYSRDNIPGEGGLGSGSKPLKLPVKGVSSNLPQTYSADTPEDGDEVDYVSVEDPSNIEGVVELDYEEIMTKQLKEKINPILQNVGMDWDDAIAGTEDATLGDYL